MKPITIHCVYARTEQTLPKLLEASFRLFLTRSLSEQRALCAR